MAVAQAANDLRIPPQNSDAERCVLGSILLLNEAIDEVAEILRPECFYNDTNQRIYACVRTMYERGVRGIDLVTLAEELDATDQLGEVGGPQYLEEIAETVPHAAHVRYYANIVRGKWIQRSLIYACTEILKESYSATSETDELLQQAEQRIFRILESQEQNASLRIRDILMDAFDRIEDRAAAGGTISGLSSGFADLDKKTNGFQPSELIVLASRPSMGKTALVCNFAEHAVRESNKAVLIFSLEQASTELAERFLCLHALINGHDLRGGNVTDEQREKLMAASSVLSEYPLFIDDQSGRTMGQVSAIARRMHRKHSLGLIVVDYLQLVEPEERSTPREQQIAQITRRLKALAKDLKVPVMALAQLNRAVEQREDKRPRLADLRESGAIEQDADLVMFLHRPDQYDPNDRPGEAEILVAKHRSGPTGTINLTWRGEFMKFENYSPPVHEPDGGYFT